MVVWHVISTQEMLALGKEVTVRTAGEHLAMARDGSVSTVINGALLTYWHVFTRSLSLSLTGRRETPGCLLWLVLTGPPGDKDCVTPGRLLPGGPPYNCSLPRIW